MSSLLDERGGQSAALLQPGEGALAVWQAARGEVLFRNVASEPLGFAELDARCEALAARRIARTSVSIRIEEEAPLRTPRKTVEPCAPQASRDRHLSIGGDEICGALVRPRNGG